MIDQELESSREQLLAVTDELEQRDDALDAANDDLFNVLASMEIPIVIVDSERRIRRFLPAASK